MRGLAMLPQRQARKTGRRGRHARCFGRPMHADTSPRPTTALPDREVPAWLFAVGFLVGGSIDAVVWTFYPAGAGLLTMLLPLAVGFFAMSIVHVALANDDRREASTSFVFGCEVGIVVFALILVGARMVASTRAEPLDPIASIRSLGENVAVAGQPCRAASCNPAGCRA